MPTMRRYRCVIRWQHRKFGPQLLKVASEGSSIRRAINAALLSFFSDRSAGPKARRDAHASVEVQCWREKKPTAAP